MRAVWHVLWKVVRQHIIVPTKDHHTSNRYLQYLVLLHQSAFFSQQLHVLAEGGEGWHDKVSWFQLSLLRYVWCLPAEKCAKDQKQTQFEFPDLILGMRHCWCSWRQFCAGSAALNGRQGRGNSNTADMGQGEAAELLLTCVTKVTAVVTGMHVTKATAAKCYRGFMTVCHQYHPQLN